MEQNEKRSLDHQSSLSRKPGMKPTQLQHMLHFVKKEGWRQWGAQSPEDWANHNEEKLASSRNEFWSRNCRYLPNCISKLLWTSGTCVFEWECVEQLFYASPTAVCWVCGWQITCLFSSQANRLRWGFTAPRPDLSEDILELKRMLWWEVTLSWSPNDPCILVFTLECGCLSHCTRVGLHYRKMSPLRLSYKRQHLLSWAHPVLDYLPWGNPAAVVWGHKGSLWRGPQIRNEASSQS